MIRAELEREYRLGRASVERRKPPMNIVGKGKGGVFPCRHGGKGVVDFEGTLLPGRSVKFDAKHTQVATRFDFKGVSDEQLEYMARHARCGAITFLYVLSDPTDGRAQTRWVIPVCERARIAGIAHARSHEALIAPDLPVSVRFDELDPAMQVHTSESWVDAVLRLDVAWWAKEAA